MQDDLASSLGFYTPSFFRIQVETEHSLDDVPFNLPIDVSATLFHEYIHFLQDLTTTYGLMNIHFIVDYMKTVSNNQQQSATRELDIPYILSAEKDNLVYHNSNLQKLYKGDLAVLQAKSITNLQVKITTIATPDVEGQLTNLEVETFQLEGVDQHDNNITYLFGSHAIIESMAYEIEIATHGEVHQAPPSLPYSAARFTVDLLLPGFSEDRLRIIALCDWSLMDFHPARMFYQSIQFIKETGNVFTDPAEIYTFLRSHFKANFLGFTENSDLFSYMSVSSASQISSYFTSPIFGQNKIWFEYLFTKAAIIRRDHSTFFLELARGGPIKDNPVFKNLYRELGLPITTNVHGQAVYNSAHVHFGTLKPEMTWVIHQVFNIYINSNASRAIRCNLVRWCQESAENAGIEDYTDFRCYEAPWKRVNDAAICPFIQVWKTWGMAKEIPVSRRT